MPMVLCRWYCCRLQLAVAEYLLGKGASQLAADREGKTAIFYAIEAGNTDVVKLLLAKDQQSLSSLDR